MQAINQIFYPAMVAEWSKTPVLQIQVASGHLGPRFESNSGHKWLLMGMLCSIVPFKAMVEKLYIAWMKKIRGGGQIPHPNSHLCWLMIDVP